MLESSRQTKATSPQFVPFRLIIVQRNITMSNTGGNHYNFDHHININEGPQRAEIGGNLDDDDDVARSDQDTAARALDVIGGRPARASRGGNRSYSNPNRGPSRNVGLHPQEQRERYQRAEDAPFHNNNLAGGRNAYLHGQEQADAHQRAAHAPPPNDNSDDAVRGIAERGAQPAGPNEDHNNQDNQDDEENNSHHDSEGSNNDEVGAVAAPGGDEDNAVAADAIPDPDGNEIFLDHDIDGGLLQADRSSEAHPKRNLRIINIRKTAQPEYLTNHRFMDRSGVVAVVLGVRCCIRGNDRTMVQVGPNRSAAGGGPNKAARLASAANPVQYDRILTLADCSSRSGLTFAVFFAVKREAEEFFQHMTAGQKGVGDVVLLEEVYPTTETLGKGTNVTLIKRVTRAIPLDANIVDMIPEVPLKTPRKGNTRFFSKHGETELIFWHAVLCHSEFCGGFLW
jgi:hypothetical protein